MDLTLAGLLNALDGLASGTSGRITVLTSNHPGLLDSALLRPGRVDMAAAFEFPARPELLALFRSFYPAADGADAADAGATDAADAAEAFADAVMGGGFAEATRSVATLQQLFIKHRKAPAAAVVADVVPFLTMVEACGPTTGSGAG